MLVNGARPIPPEHKLPPSQGTRLTADLQDPDGLARYYKNLAAQRQKIKKVIEEAIPKQEYKNETERLAFILRKFYKI